MNDARPPQKPAPAPGKRAAWVLAIAMHLLLAAFLIYGVHWQTKAPEAVEVELVTSVPAPPAAVPPAPTSEPEPTPPKPEPKPEPRPEPKPLPPPPKPDIAVKEPVKKSPPPKVSEKVPPKEPIKETPKPPDPFQDQLRRESERLDKHKLTSALDKELNAARTAQAAAAQSKGAADWGARIRGKIRGNIVLPPETKGNPEAIFDVALLPCSKDGCDIITIRLKKSTGSASLDAAIERAILKSSPLPKPEQSEVFRRDLELKFRPMEPEQL